MSQPSEQEMNQMLDQARGEVFRSENAAFLGSVLCSLDFRWDPDMPHETASTDYVSISWHPKDFLRCNQNERTCTLIHEVWHPARLHNIRGEGLDQEIWNQACDIRINNDMIRDGYKLPDNGYWLFDPSIDAGGILSEEEIYEKLINGQIKKPPGKGRPGCCSAVPGGDKSQQAVQKMAQVAMVVRAVQAAVMAGKAGTVPGSVRKALDDFLDPVIPWRETLAQFMTDLTGEDYSWRKRNRRYPETYMPSMEFVPDGLEHLIFFIDVSASITDPAVKRFNSEVKYIWENLHPKRLTLVQFDTKIQNVREFTEGDTFQDIEVYGRGGTSMVEVREYIEEKRPTAAVIFSDMECTPMKPLSFDIPVLFAVLPGGHAELPGFGKIIHIKD